MLTSRLLKALSFVAVVAAISPQASNAEGAGSGADDAGAPPGASAAALGMTDLVDDLSRQQLFVEIKKAEALEDPKAAQEGIEYFNLYGPFRFPNDVDVDSVLHQKRVDSLFGVDISHYTHANFPIESLRAKKALFLYMKASQGTGSLDGKFAQFWARAGRLPQGAKVHRGAYHFLSSGDPSVAAADWGKAQAKTFVKVIKANGGLSPTDMPPVVDLEWDKASADGPDRWGNRNPDEIIAEVTSFLTEVEAELHRKPMIYTARSWWLGRMGAEKRFAALSSYPVWLADYSKSARASESPKLINGKPYALWQFTETANMAMGFADAFDANIFKGKPETFLSNLGVQDFAQ
jgi:lysozyme